MADDDKPLLLVEKVEDSTCVSLSNAVLYLDIALIDTLCGNYLKLVKAIELDVGPKEPSKKSPSETFTLKVSSSYLQVPLKDSKNCIFVQMQGLCFSPEAVSLDLFHIYIARSFEQRKKYTFALI